MNALRILLAIVLVALGIVAFSSVYTVSEREQALVLQFGKVKRLVNTPGLHFKVPLVQNVTYYDKRVLEYDASAVEIPTRDQKQVVVDSFTRYRIVDPLKYFQAVGNETKLVSRLGRIVGATLRAEFGKATMADILTPERAIIMGSVAKQVKVQTVKFGIDVIDVRIKRVDLPAKNSQAIFRRMQTQREQEARRIRAEGQKESKRIKADADKQARVILAEANKTSQIERGKGDGLAQKIYNNAYGRDREFYDFWVRMRTARSSLTGNRTRYVGPPVFDLYRMFPDVTAGRLKSK